MGKHFDTLIEVVNRHMADNEPAEGIPDVKKYFQGLVKRFTLFELPLDPKDIFPTSGKDKEEYDKYIWDYAALSRENGRALITPFKFTCVEDPISAVFFDPLADNKYRVTISFLLPKHQGKLKENLFASISCGNVWIHEPPSKDKPPMIEIKPLYSVLVENDKRYALLRKSTYNDLAYDIHTSTMSFIEEVIYLMDPANFIVERTHSECRVQKERAEKKKGDNHDFLHKTIRRPHFICLSEEDIGDFFSAKSKDPRPIRPVSGHWKKFVSEVYVNKKGQKKFVQQYLRGDISADGTIPGTEGWTYRVFLKESPVKMSPYVRE